jgi:hypothetical protein
LLLGKLATCSAKDFGREEIKNESPTEAGILSMEFDFDFNFKKE